MSNCRIRPVDVPRLLHWRRAAWALILASLAASGGSPAAEPEASPPRVTVFENGRDGYPIVRIPAVVRAANGDLVAFAEGRTGGDASEIDLVMKRSTDGGRSWGKLQVVQSHDDFRDLFDDVPISVGNPAPVVDLLDEEHPGRLWMLFTVENDHVFSIFSDDHGATWSPRHDITADVKHEGWGWYATGPGHAIQLEQGVHRGRLVVACDHRIGRAGQDRGANGVQAVLSDDHGQTWRIGAVDDTYDDGLNANETAVIELADGRLYFNTRDQNGAAPGTRGEAWSEDGGATFSPSGESEWKWFRPSAEALDPPVVEISLLRVNSSNQDDTQGLILFCGPDEHGPTGGGRNDLRIRFSTDGARTWQDGPLLHTGPAAYSDLVQIRPDGDEVGILFEAGDSPSKKCNRIEFLIHRTQSLAATGGSARRL